MRRLLLSLFAGLTAAILMLPAIAQGEPATQEITLEGMGGFFGADAPEDITIRQEPPSPANRAKQWVPRDPGTEEWVTLDFGPYTIHPGSDLTRIEAEIAGADGYAVGFIPEVVYPDGTMASSHDIHIHHAHWFWLDPDNPDTHRWFYGTGEERTQGSIEPAAKMHPDYDKGLRYGVPLNRGDRVSFLSMLHNKTAQAQVVYIRVRIQYVFGTHDQIKEATGLDYRDLTPVLIGSTFNVPRTGGMFDYPLSTTKKNIGPHSNYCNPFKTCDVVPGLGQTWEAPWDGTLVIGAGHAHPGSKGVVLSNLGSKKDPCPNDGDRYPGTTAAYSRTITRGNVFPSEEFQMGLTQPAWRLHVRKGDRLVINGAYNAKPYAYPDAMSYFGMYFDRSEKTSDSEACRAELIGRPDASRDEIIQTLPNQRWESKQPMPTCAKCNQPGPLPEPGPETNVVHIAGHTYLPGNLGQEGMPFGPPVVQKGETLTFVNEDYGAGAVRHSVTSCKVPCNGEYTVNYPFADGIFESGAIGFMYQETYVSANDEPRWELDTSKLDKGYYTYYCRLHAWMRGGFYVK